MKRLKARKLAKTIHKGSGYKPGTILKTIRNPAEFLRPNEWIVDPGIQLLDGTLSYEQVLAKSQLYFEDETTCWHRKDVYDYPVMLIESRYHVHQNYWLKVIVDERVCWINSANIYGVYR